MSEAVEDRQHSSSSETVGAAAPSDRPVGSAIERILAATSEVSLARDHEGIMRVVRRTARELTSADGATFVLRQGDHCYYADEEAIEPLWKGKRFPMRLCISGWVMLNRTSTIIEDIYDDPRVPIDAYCETFVKSLAMVPIRKAAPIGAIGVYWAERHAPTAEQMGLLQGLAEAVSVAMQNVTLHAELDAKIAELDHASRVKDEFLATLSHELRTPINVIQGWASLLAEGAVPENDRLNAIQTILRNARAEVRLIQDLLDTTAIVSGKLSIDVREEDPIELLMSAVQSIAATAQRQQIALRLDAPAQPLGSVAVDLDRMHQVLMNVLGNAVKFTPRGGTVRIALRREGPSAVFEVADDGAGIAADVLPHVFQRFRQADSSNTRTYGGLGLGLTLAKHILEAHGGSIDVRSAGVMLGTTVTIRVPLTRLAPAV
jgi:signal transduction histidine kinase